MTSYDALAALAERELELVSAGRFDRLPELHDRRDALVAALPPVPPSSARAALERTAALQERVTAALAGRRDELSHDLRRLTHGRSAVRGYAPQVARHGLVDREV
jgi:hypothetical protein